MGPGTTAGNGKGGIMEKIIKVNNKNYEGYKYLYETEDEILISKSSPDSGELFYGSWCDENNNTDINDVDVVVVAAKEE